MVKNDCYCGGTTQRRRITKTISLRGEKIPLENVLVRVCSDCGEIYFDGKMIDSLDTKQISDGECSSEFADLPEKVPKRQREVSWRKYILENGLESYFEKLAEQVEKTRYARKCFLSLKYKYAMFRTLDGVSFSFEQL